MQYTQLTNDYKYQHLANAIYAREVEYFHYDFDLINFLYMVEGLPEGAFKNDIVTRIKDVEDQMGSVQIIMKALWAQVDDVDSYTKAVEYVTQKRAQEGGEK